MDSAREPRKLDWVLWAARILALLWAAWWTYFAVGSGIVEGGGATGLIMHVLWGPPVVLFLLMVWLAWRRAKLGGIVFVCVSVALAVAYVPLVHAPGPRPALRTAAGGRSSLHSGRPARTENRLRRLPGM